MEFYKRDNLMYFILNQCYLLYLLLSQLQNMQTHQSKSKRVYTQPTSPNIFDGFQLNKLKLSSKIIGRNVNSENNQTFDLKKQESRDEPYKSQSNSISFNNRKSKLRFFNKLPQIRQCERQRQSIKAIDLKMIKNDRQKMFLNPIVNQNINQKDMLNSYTEPDQGQTNQFLKQKKLQSKNKKSLNNHQKYLNQFSDMQIHQSTKNYRAPRILQKQLKKFSYNVGRRISQSDKQSQNAINFSDEIFKKQQRNLSQIEILTFSNKFPFVNKDSLPFKKNQFNEFTE